MTYIYGEVTISITLVHICHFTVTHIQKKKKKEKWLFPCDENFENVPLNNFKYNIQQWKL